LFVWESFQFILPLVILRLHKFTYAGEAPPLIFALEEFLQPVLALIIHLLVAAFTMAKPL